MHAGTDKIYSIYKADNIVKILINSKTITTTDLNGFFKIVVDKRELPLEIEALVYGKLVKYNIEYNINKDFSISTGYFEDEKIHIVNDFRTKL